MLNSQCSCGLTSGLGTETIWLGLQKDQLVAPKPGKMSQRLVKKCSVF